MSDNSTASGAIVDAEETSPPLPEDPDIFRHYWFLEGMRSVFSLPGFILMSATIGFTAFAAQSGLTRGEATFASGAIWALPSQLIVVSAIVGGKSVFAAFVAVCLASIRMTPMVAALIPALRGERKVSQLLLLLLSHLVAVTAWVYTLRVVDDIPRHGRIAFFAGLGLTLAVFNTALVYALFGVISELPPLAAGTLYLLTPMYFLMSIWGSARQRVMHAALLGGMVLAPLFHWLAPEIDLLLTGVIGGTVVYAIDRASRKTKQ